MKGVLCLAAMLCGAVGPSALDLVKDGKPGAVIVIPDDLSIFAKRSSEDLQYHIRKATGAKLEIKKQSEAASVALPKVYIEKPEGLDIDSLNRNGFYIKNVGDDLVIMHVSRGWATIPCDSGGSGIGV